MRRRACVYQPTNQNIAPVIKNVGVADNLEILVDNFWIPRSKTRTSSSPGFLTKAVLLLFFALVRAFAFFLFKAKTTLIVLWILTSNISPHFAEFAGMKFEDHKRNVDTNRFVSEIH